MEAVKFWYRYIFLIVCITFVGELFSAFPGSIAPPPTAQKYNSTWQPQNLGKEIPVDPHSLLANTSYTEASENIQLLSKGVWEFLITNFRLNNSINYGTTTFPTNKGLGYIPLARDTIYSDFTTFLGYLKNGLSQQVTTYSSSAPLNTTNTVGTQTTLTVPGYSALFTQLLTTVAEFTPENSTQGGDLPLLFSSNNGLVKALTDIKNCCLYYLRGRVSLITPLSYATSNSVNFLGNGYFDPTLSPASVNGSGVLANIFKTQLQVSSTLSPLEQLRTYIQTYALNSSNQLFGVNLSTLDESSISNYKNVLDTFIFETASIIANWGEQLITGLSQIYNPQFFIMGNGATSLQGAGASFQIPPSMTQQLLAQDPNIQLLDCYGQLTIDATHQVATLAQTLGVGASVGMYSYINTASTSNTSNSGVNSTIESSSAATFFGNVDVDIYTKLGQISAYLGLKNMSVARKYAGGYVPQHSSSVSDDGARTQGIVTALMTAYQAFKAASGYYSKAENNLYQQLYGTRSDSLYLILIDMLAAANRYQILDQQIHSGQGTIASIIDGFTKIRQQYNSAADSFSQIGENDLSLYMQRLQAQTGIMEYQQILASTVKAYQPSINNYIQYAIQNPFVSSFDSAFATNAQNQQKNFQNTLLYIQQQLAAASSTYSAELNFYESLGSEITPDETTLSNNIRQAVQIFQYLNDGISNIVLPQTASSVSTGSTSSGNSAQISPVVGSISQAQQGAPSTTGSASISKVTQTLSNATSNSINYSAQDGKELSSLPGVSVQSSNTQNSVQTTSSLPTTTQMSVSEILTQTGGADNKLLTVLSASGSDAIMQSILAAEDAYMKALACFKEADDLLAQSTSNSALSDVLNYTQIQQLFENQNANLYAVSGFDGKPAITTFSDYLFLHQARLYYYMAQELAAKQEPLAAYLFYMSVAYYSLLANGDTESWAENNCGQVYQILQTFLGNNPTVVTSLYNDAKNLIANIASNKNGTPEQIAQQYKAALLYYFIAFETVSDQTTIVNDYRAAAQQALSFFQTQVGKTSQDAVSYPQLDAAMVAYQLYLINANMSASGVLKSDPNLSQALTLLNAFKTTHSIMPQSSATTQTSTPQPIDDASLDSVIITDAQFATQSADLTNKKDALLAARSAEILQEVLLAKFNFNDSQVTELDFTVEKGDFEQSLGYLYIAYAHSKLKALQAEFISGGTYNEDKVDEFKTILSLYYQSSQYYVQAGLPAQGLIALQGISKTIAWQYYSWVIPVYEYDITQILSSAATVSQGEQPVSVITSPSSCAQQDTDITSLVVAHPDWPGYVLHYNKQLIPQSLITPAVTYYVGTGPTTKTSIVTDIVIPLKQYIFNQALTTAGATSQTTPAQIQNILKEYQNQIESVLSGLVKACATKVALQGSFEVVQEKDNNGQQQTYLISRNIPMPAFPRFSGDLESAYYFYTQGSLKLYQSGTAPISFAGQMLLPANDVAGQNTVNRALYNAHMVNILAQESNLQTTLNTSVGNLPAGSTPIYQTLQNLTAAQRLTDDLTKHPNFTDYHTFYLDEINSLMIDMLSSLDSIVSFAQTMEGTDKDAFTAFTKKQEATKYLDWMNICKNFLLGDPTDNHYMALLNPIVNFASQAQGLLIENVAPSASVPVNNQIVASLAQVYENAGDILMSLNAPYLHVVTNSGTIYPIPVPGIAGPYKWADAVNFYGNAVDIYTNEYQQLVQNGTTQTAALTHQPPSDVGLRLYQKLATATYDEANFLLATFAYNAFEECKCPQINQKNSDGTTSLEYERAVSFPQATNLDTLQNIVCGTNGATYKPTATGFYQGVAAAFTPSFKQVLQGAATGLSSIFSGSSNQSTVAITQAGDLMNKSYALRAIGLYSSLIGSGSVGSGTATQNFPSAVSLTNLIAAAGVSDSSTQQLTVKQAMSSYIAQIMTTNPGFATNVQAAGNTTLPVIQVPVASEESGTSSSSGVKGTEVSFVPLAATTAGMVELSDNNQMYLPTLQYWASLVGQVNGKPQFAGALSDAFTQWISKPQYLFEWVAQLSFMARRLYGSAYIPGGESNMTVMNAQIDQSLQTLVNSNFSTSGEYIGTAQRTQSGSGN